MRPLSATSRYIALLQVVYAPLILAARPSAHQPPGTIVIDASQFLDQIPSGDNIAGRGRFNRTVTTPLFNNTGITLSSKEDAIARINVPEPGTYYLFVHSQGTPTSSFRVSVGEKTTDATFGHGPMSFQSGGSFELKRGVVEVRLTAIHPRPMLDVIVLSKNSNFQENDLNMLELPEQVEVLREYHTQPANIVKFGDVDGDGKPDILVITRDYSAYVYNNAGKELWHWNAPAEGARLRAQFEAPGSIWDFDRDGYAEVIHWRMVDGKEWLVMADGRTGAIKKKVPWPTPPMPHVYNNFRTAIARFHSGYADDLLVFTDSGGLISLTDYDKDLNQIWQYSEHRRKDYFGHYIYPIDLNGDGIDEVVISHLCLDANGKTIWNNRAIFDDNHDHMDAMEFFDINGDGKLELIVGQSDVGTLAYRAMTGELLWQNLSDHTQQVTAGYILRNSKTPQVVVNARTYGTPGGGRGGLGAQLYWFTNRGDLISKWPRNPISGNPNFVRGDWFGNGKKEYFWYKFKLEGDGTGTLYFKEPVYHMFDFMGNGAEQVITNEGGLIRVYGYRGVKPKVVKRDSEYIRNSIANHTHY